SETVSRLAYRWGTPYISTSTRSTQNREANTIAMEPDLQGGLASALLAMLEELGMQKVLVVFSEEFKVAASYVTAGLGQYAKKIYYPFGEDHLWPDHSQVVVVLLNSTQRIPMLNDLLHADEAHSNFIIYDDGWSDPVEFYEDLENLLFLNSFWEVAMEDFVLLQSVYGSEIRNYALTNNLTMNMGLVNTLLLCDALSLLDLADPENLVETFDQQYQGFTGPVLITESGSRQPFFNVFDWGHGELVLNHSVYPLVLPCNETSDTNCSFYIAEFNAVPSTLFQDKENSCRECTLKYALVAVLIVFGVVYYFFAAVVLFELIIFEERAADSSNVLESGLPEHYAIQERINEFRTKKSFHQSIQVFIKKYHQKRALTFTQSEIKRLDQLRNLSNSNLNQFIGISFNQCRELMVVWAYCPRNSLDDIIFEKDRRFGRNFQCSFLKHILKGLQYIHGSSIGFHGALYLSNCVVDANWVVKLTDFGIQEIIWDKMLHKELSCYQEVDVDHLPLKYLQYSPEVLRNVLAEGLLGHGSQKSDIYQLGMIIYQILFHERPFAEKTNYTPKEMALLICDGLRGGPDQPFYPAIPEQHDYSLRLLSVMQQVLSGIRSLLDHYLLISSVAHFRGKGNVIDQMARIIDDYSENLELMVQQRTKALEASLLRTENLLFHIMPKNIADGLRMGVTIHSQMHPCVSMLVADICKFTELCESTIPVQVIDILQDLYSSFDKIISEYQVFKVENVGDTYLLASGLDEVPNHLCEFVEGYEIKHTSISKLRVKFGIHSGSVASGILGSTAPR
ncbi:Guanylate cyclase, partial [Trichostrongylus colubriformis]